MITDEARAKEGRKILKRCDKDKNGNIDKREFVKYYRQTVTAMKK